MLKHRADGVRAPIFAGGMGLGGKQLDEVHRLIEGRLCWFGHVFHVAVGLHRVDDLVDKGDLLGLRGWSLMNREKASIAASWSSFAIHQIKSPKGVSPCSLTYRFTLAR